MPWYGRTRVFENEGLKMYLRPSLDAEDKILSLDLVGTAMGYSPNKHARLIKEWVGRHNSEWRAADAQGGMAASAATLQTTTAQFRQPGLSFFAVRSESTLDAVLREALEQLSSDVMRDISEAKRRLDADLPKDGPVHPVSAFLTGMAISVGKARAALSASGSPGDCYGHKSKNDEHRSD